MNKNYGQERAALVRVGPVELLPVSEVLETPKVEPVDGLTDFATTTTMSKRIKEAAWLLVDFLQENPDGVLDENWKQQGVCRVADSATLYPERKSGVSEEAKKICGRRAVRAQCLVFALRTSEPYGIWGGVSSAQRRQLRESIGDVLLGIFGSQDIA